MKPPSNPTNDLEAFAENQSESVFAGIVTEYGGLVFASALRRTGDLQLAEEIT